MRVPDPDKPQPNDDLPGYAVLVIAAAGLIVFAAAFVGHLMGADAGSYADWLAAIATLAAFAAASIAGWFAHRALRVEQARDRARDDLQTRSQAELVAAWVQMVWFKAGGATTTPTKFVPSEYQLFLRNASELPVLVVTAVISARVHRPGGQAVHRLGTMTLEILAPSGQAERRDLGQGVQEKIEALNQALGEDERLSVTAGIAFTDTGGRHWIREDDGVLEPAPEELVRLRIANLPL